MPESEWAPTPLAASCPAGLRYLWSVHQGAQHRHVRRAAGPCIGPGCKDGGRAAGGGADARHGGASESLSQHRRVVLCRANQCAGPTGLLYTGCWATGQNSGQTRLPRGPATKQVRASVARRSLSAPARLRPLQPGSPWPLDTAPRQACSVCMQRRGRLRAGGTARQGSTWRVEQQRTHRAWHQSRPREAAGAQQARGDQRRGGIGRTAGGARRAIAAPPLSRSTPLSRRPAAGTAPRHAGGPAAHGWGKRRDMPCAHRTIGSARSSAQRAAGPRRRRPRAAAARRQTPPARASPACPGCFRGRAQCSPATAASLRRPSAPWPRRGARKTARTPRARGVGVHGCRGPGKRGRQCGTPGAGRRGWSRARREAPPGSPFARGGSRRVHPRLSLGIKLLPPHDGVHAQFAHFFCFFISTRSCGFFWNHPECRNVTLNFVFTQNPRKSHNMRVSLLVTVAAALAAPGAGFVLRPCAHAPTARPALSACHRPGA